MSDLVHPSRADASARVARTPSDGSIDKRSGAEFTDPAPSAPTVIVGQGAAHLASRASRSGAVRVASLFSLIAFWAVASWIGNDPEVLPSPLAVASLTAREAVSGELWLHISATLSRVVAAFVVAMAIGTAIGIAMGRNEQADRWLDSWLVVALNLPALVVIVLCYLWIGLSEVAAIAAVAINKVPLVAVMLREGTRALDPNLDRMSRAFAMPRGAWLRHIVLPQLAPHIVAAARTGLALIWKIVLVVEFLGRPDGVGFQIHLYFQLFDVGRVLAYALSFVAVMLLIEVILLQPLERAASHWRRA